MGTLQEEFCAVPKLSSEIIVLDENLIINFAIILQVIVSGRRIDFAKCLALITETRWLYLHLFGWYYIPSSGHKLLVHGAEIITSFYSLGLLIGHPWRK